MWNCVNVELKFEWNYTKKVIFYFLNNFPEIFFESQILLASSYSLPNIYVDWNWCPGGAQQIVLIWQFFEAVGTINGI